MFEDLSDFVLCLRGQCRRDLLLMLDGTGPQDEQPS